MGAYLRCNTYHLCTPVALEVASKPQKLFGRPLTIEVSYCSPKPQEESVLVVKGLPEDIYMDVNTCKQALQMYLSQDVVTCEVIEGVAYLRFQDQSGMLYMYNVSFRPRGHTEIDGSRGAYVRVGG